MDVIEPILSIASKIYSLVKDVKANKKRSERICHRVKNLDQLVRSIKNRELGKTTAEVETTLKELSLTLESALALIKQYTETNCVKRFLQAGNHEDDFNIVNERLNDAFQALSGALQVEHSNVLFKVFAMASRMKQDKDDRREDDAELLGLLLHYLNEQQEKKDDMQRGKEITLDKVKEILNKPSDMVEAIRMIKPHELKYEHPKEPFIKTPTSEVYKGQYRSFQVAIKRYTDTADSSLSAVRKDFNKDVETMRQFESPNILRMFGICEQQDGGRQQLLIITEFCEKGSLRQVLDSEGLRLSWTTKARMCRDAARGLYRLHHTEEKSKVHGCINSDKFLVAEGYIVKLGGFELSKTETSLRNMTKHKVLNQSPSLSYTAPEMLDVNKTSYSMESEIYSFGIVLWEVATGKRPFDGLTNEDIIKKGTSKEELPPDCPKGLADLIDACRAHDGFQRPSAGVLVDRLQIVVAELKES